MAGCYMQSILSMSIFSWNAQYPLLLYCCQHHSFHHRPMDSWLLNSQAPSHDLLISRTLTQLYGVVLWRGQQSAGWVIHLPWTGEPKLSHMLHLTCVCVCWVCTLCGYEVISLTLASDSLPLCKRMWEWEWVVECYGIILCVVCLYMLSVVLTLFIGSLLYVLYALHCPLTM